MRAGPTGAERQSDIESVTVFHDKVPRKSVGAVVVREADKSKKWVLVYTGNTARWTEKIGGKKKTHA